jgi:hypothetical protein
MPHVQVRRESVKEHPGASHPVYLGVMQHVAEMFDEIKEGVTDYGISNCIRAALLQPISSLALKQVRPWAAVRGAQSHLVSWPADLAG